MNITETIAENADDFIKLKKEIDSFLETFSTSEWAFCEGDDSFTYYEKLAEEKAKILKDRIRGLAIELGIHAEFLKEYEGIKIAA